MINTFIVLHICELWYSYLWSDPTSMYLDSTRTYSKQNHFNIREMYTMLKINFQAFLRLQLYSTASSAYHRALEVLERRDLKHLLLPFHIT